MTRAISMAFTSTMSRSSSRRGKKASLRQYTARRRRVWSFPFWGQAPAVSGGQEEGEGLGGERAEGGQGVDRVRGRREQAEGLVWMRRGQVAASRSREWAGLSHTCKVRSEVGAGG